MKSILDPSFRYTSSFNTDLRKKFARIRRDLLQNVQTAARAEHPALAIIPIAVRRRLAVENSRGLTGGSTLASDAARADPLPIGKAHR
jgi:hypothetical protein